MRRESRDLVRASATPAIFMVWLISWFAVPTAVFAMGGGPGWMIAAEAVVVLVPIKVLLTRRDRP